jgi:hypothetical protein
MDLLGASEETTAEVAVRRTNAELAQLGARYRIVRE